MTLNKIWEHRTTDKNGKKETPLAFNYFQHTYRWVVIEAYEK